MYSEIQIVNFVVFVHKLVGLLILFLLLAADGSLLLHLVGPLDPLEVDLFGRQMDMRELLLFQSHYLALRF